MSGFVRNPSDGVRVLQCGFQVADGVRLGVEGREGDAGLEEALGAVDGLEPLVGRGDVAVAVDLADLAVLADANRQGRW